MSSQTAGFDLSDLTDKIIDKAKDHISEQITEFTDGKVSVDSLLKGQLNVDANSYIDDALSLLKQKVEGQGLNEIGLPTQAMEFQKDIACGIIIPGKIDLDDGRFSGLSSFCRFTPAQIKIDVFGDPIIAASTSIGLKETCIDYTTKIDFLCFGPPDATVFGKLKDVELAVSIIVGRDFKVSLNHFDVTNSGSLTVDCGNFGSFDFLSDTVSTNLQKTIKDAVMEFLEKTVKSMIHEIVSELPIKIF